MTNTETLKLTSRKPRISGEQLAQTLVPPPQFASASFASYVPDPQHPSQQYARDLLQSFISTSGLGTRKSGGAGLFSRFFSKAKDSAPENNGDADSPQIPDGKQGVYLDGGFGVGKTHLLAAAWHAQPGVKYFGTFIQYTALVGALGYDGAVRVLSGAKLICIDEFELDDPGDTMLMTRLIKDLTQLGAKFIATSNTPPNALGEGRFAAADFMREIQAMSDRFMTVRIDGADYRQRHIEGAAVVYERQELEESIANACVAGLTVSCDEFAELLSHLEQVHPSSYTELLNGVDVIALIGSFEIADQSAALRFVAFIDRVYDAQIPILATGTPLNDIFGGGMLDGGYRKKYLRCMSRVNALCAMPVTA